MLVEGKQILQDVALFLCRARTLQDVIAVALEPLFDFGRIGEALWVRGRSEWRDRFACLGVFAGLHRRLCVTGSAAPVVGVARFEELLATLRGETRKRVAGASSKLP